MKLSTKCRYGARAVVEIACREHEGPVKRKDIVANQEISDSYLENILITLKNNGIISAVRGKFGGYTLQKPATEITLYEIVNILEGSLAPVPCIDNPSSCTRIKICSTRGVWIKLHQVEEELLRSITVQQLVDDLKSGDSSNFHI